MSATAVQNFTSWWQHVGWFDVVLVVVLAFGVWRGRKRGMSREALPTLFWLAAVVGGGLGYRPLGEIILKSGYVRQVFGTSLNERTASFVISYLAIAFASFMIYSFLAKRFKEKLAGSNAFGSGEYYLGMLAGLIRFGCLLFFILALLKAPYYSAADIAAKRAYNNRWYGGGEKNFSGDFIPGMDEIQAGVFNDSMSGRFIQDNMSAFLVSNNAPKSKRIVPAATSN